MIAKRRGQLVFLVAVIVSLAAVFYVSYNNMVKTAEVFDRQENVLKESQWRYVWGKAEALYAQARDKSKTIADNIKRQILMTYKSNGRNLSYDLQHLNQDKHPIIEIFANNVVGSYLNNLHSDSDDPFVANRRGIASDFSVDCSAEGRTRSFDKEISLHFSKDLAKQAIDKILSLDRSIIGWQFSKPKNYDMTVPEFSHYEIHKLFMKYGLESLSTLEFLAPAYIDENIDLVGTNLVDSAGMRHENEQIIVVQGFNVVKQINASSDGKSTLTWYTENIDSVKRDKGVVIGFFSATLVFVVTLMILVYLIGMSQIERARDERRKPDEVSH